MLLGKVYNLDNIVLTCGSLNCLLLICLHVYVQGYPYKLLMLINTFQCFVSLMFTASSTVTFQLLYMAIEHATIYSYVLADTPFTSCFAKTLQF